MSEDRTPLMEIDGLHIEASIDGAPRTLVTDMSLRLNAGEVLAIVGESGSGKSLTARAIVGLLPRGLKSSGRVDFEGRDLLAAREKNLQQIRGSGIALVMQDPFTTLNPLMKCHVQLRPTRGRRLSRSESREEAVRRLAEVGIHDANVADRYPWQLSGGMRQRVALAAALSNDPRLLVADEFSTALDVTTQKEIWLLLRRLQEARGMGLLIITHDLRMAFSMCDRVYVMYAGSLMETGSAHDLSGRPLHPYTLGLLLAEPSVEQASRAERFMNGSVPRADEVAGSCAFAARCPWSADECVAGQPPLRSPEGDPSRLSACVRIESISAEMVALGQQPSVDRRTEARRVAESDEQVLRVEDLRKVFGARSGGSSSSQVTALDGITLEIAAGESVGLVGESGSGKTTLARCLVGLEVPSSGSIEIVGIDATDRSSLGGERRKDLCASIQYIFQDPYSSLNPRKTVGATLAEATALRFGRDKRKVEGRVRELLDLVGLPSGYLGRKPMALSGGERQRVAIARALSLEPRVVICDEPVSALDVSVQAQVLDLLNGIREETGVSYLFITHDLAVVRQVADRICVLYRGQLVEQGSTNELLDDPTHDYTRTLLAAVPGQWDRDSGVALSSAPAAQLDERQNIS